MEMQMLFSEEPAVVSGFMEEGCEQIPLATLPETVAGHIFTPEELRVVGDALDLGIHDEDEFFNACRSKWESLRPTRLQLISGTNGPWIEGKADASRRQDQLEQIRSKVMAQELRGSWCALRWTESLSDGRKAVCWHAMMANGQGNVTEERFYCLPGDPRTPNAGGLYEKMIRSEVAQARMAEETRRDRWRSETMIRARGWIPGARLRNVVIEKTLYSSAKILDVQGSYLVLELTRRGSRRRWLARVLGHQVRISGAA